MYIHTSQLAACLVKLVSNLNQKMCMYIFVAFSGKLSTDLCSVYEIP